MGLLADAVQERGRPRGPRIDHRPAFTRRGLNQWACAQGIACQLIGPGTSVQNASSERGNGRMRDEFLNVHPFPRVPQAKLSLAI
ncbi:integrase core domain-containing protein [Deinococcus multiflagellatus]|uniref:Integrase core domain-containing protein n=1 Tax=Deinococcus multiflagellatus TaxID=1656887 RepID=A0ABW1ZR36_9DEIO|nr:integrase core domain-containing protein [Deinococcus multiflagellatus]